MKQSGKNFKIAIASGKGGTGKTTVSTNLFTLFEELTDHHTTLVDCDVEEPNDLLFFEKSSFVSKVQVNQMIPSIDMEKCTFCRACVEVCEFNAIVVIPPAGFARVNDSLCHSCGACTEFCEYDAISETPSLIGEINQYQTSEKGVLKEGRLKIGSAMQTMLIRDLKKELENKEGLILLDAPPGTSCPVVTTISDVDFVLLVTEPTPFGLHDLKLMVELVQEMNKKLGLVINKAGIGDKGVYEYAREQEIPVIAEIPFSRSYARKYANGSLLDDMPENFRQAYREIIDFLQKQMN